MSKQDFRNLETKIPDDDNFYTMHDNTIKPFDIAGYSEYDLVCKKNKSSFFLYKGNAKEVKQIISELFLPIIAKNQNKIILYDENENKIKVKIQELLQELDKDTSISFGFCDIIDDEYVLCAEKWINTLRQVYDSINLAKRLNFAEEKSFWLNFDDKLDFISNFGKSKDFERLQNLLESKNKVVLSASLVSYFNVAKHKNLAKHLISFFSQFDFETETDNFEVFLQRTLHNFVLINKPHTKIIDKIVKLHYFVYCNDIIAKMKSFISYDNKLVYKIKNHSAEFLKHEKSLQGFFADVDFLCSIFTFSDSLKAINFYEKTDFADFTNKILQLFAIKNDLSEYFNDFDELHCKIIDLHIKQYNIMDETMENFYRFMPLQFYSAFQKETYEKRCKLIDCLTEKVNDYLINNDKCIKGYKKVKYLEEVQNDLIMINKRNDMCENTSYVSLVSFINQKIEDLCIKQENEYANFLNTIALILVDKRIVVKPEKYNGVECDRFNLLKHSIELYNTLLDNENCEEFLKDLILDAAQKLKRIIYCKWKYIIKNKKLEEFVKICKRINIKRIEISFLQSKITNAMLNHYFTITKCKDQTNNVDTCQNEMRIKNNLFLIDASLTCAGNNEAITSNTPHVSTYSTNDETSYNAECNDTQESQFNVLKMGKLMTADATSPKSKCNSSKKDPFSIQQILRILPYNKISLNTNACLFDINCMSESTFSTTKTNESILNIYNNHKNKIFEDFYKHMHYMFVDANYFVKIKAQVTIRNNTFFFQPTLKHFINYIPAIFGLQYSKDSDVSYANLFYNDFTNDLFLIKDKMNDHKKYLKNLKNITCSLHNAQIHDLNAISDYLFRAVKFSRHTEDITNLLIGNTFSLFDFTVINTQESALKETLNRTISCFFVNIAKIFQYFYNATKYKKAKVSTKTKNHDITESNYNHSNKNDDQPNTHLKNNQEIDAQTQRNTLEDDNTMLPVEDALLYHHTTNECVNDENQGSDHNEDSVQYLSCTLQTAQYICNETRDRINSGYSLQNLCYTRLSAESLCNCLEILIIIKTKKVQKLYSYMQKQGNIAEISDLIESCQFTNIDYKEILEKYEEDYIEALKKEKEKTAVKGTINSKIIDYENYLNLLTMYKKDTETLLNIKTTIKYSEEECKVREDLHQTKADEKTAAYKNSTSKTCMSETDTKPYIPTKIDENIKDVSAKLQLLKHHNAFYDKKLDDTLCKAFETSYKNVKKTFTGVLDNLPDLVFPTKIHLLPIEIPTFFEYIQNHHYYNDLNTKRKNDVLVDAFTVSCTKEVFDSVFIDCNILILEKYFDELYNLEKLRVSENHNIEEIKNKLCEVQKCCLIKDQIEDLLIEYFIVDPSKNERKNSKNHRVDLSKCIINEYYQESEEVAKKIQEISKYWHTKTDKIEHITCQNFLGFLKKCLQDLYKQLDSYKDKCPRICFLSKREIFKMLVNKNHIIEMLIKTFRIDKVYVTDDFLWGFEAKDIEYRFEDKVKICADFCATVNEFEEQMKKVVHKNILNHISDNGKTCSHKEQSHELSTSQPLNCINTVQKMSRHTEHSGIPTSSYNKSTNQKSLTIGDSTGSNGSTRTYEFLPVLRIYNNTIYAVSRLPMLHNLEFYAKSEMILTKTTKQIFASFLLYFSTKVKGIIVHGRSGTGKSETVKYFVKKVGQKLQVFCCDERVTSDDLYLLFDNCFASNTFLCLDEFNRLSSETMSSIHDNLCKLEHTYKKRILIFLTMNIGYKGRFNLPKSLLNVFGSVRLEHPNIKDIASFYAKDHSALLANFFKACEKKYRNLDFSIRSIKSVLSTFLNIKNSKEYEKETDITILCIAIAQNYLPMQPLDDAKRFEAFINSFFSTNIPKLDYKRRALHNKRGIILYGDSNSGKSEFIKKHFSNDVLYLNAYTHTIFDSEYYLQKIKQNKVLVFDCKLASEWIENLNSALDENKFLVVCNEKVDVSDKKFIFETNKLDNLTMATITRVQLIYFERLQGNKSVLGDLNTRLEPVSFLENRIVYTKDKIQEVLHGVRCEGKSQDLIDRILCNNKQDYQLPCDLLDLQDKHTSNARESDIHTCDASTSYVQTCNTLTYNAPICNLQTCSARTSTTHESDILSGDARAYDLQRSDASTRNVSVYNTQTSDTCISNAVIDQQYAGHNEQNFSEQGLNAHISNPLYTQQTDTCNCDLIYNDQFIFYCKVLEYLFNTQRVIILEGNLCTGKKSLVKAVLSKRVRTIFMQELIFEGEMFNTGEKTVIITLESNYEKLREYFYYEKIGKTKIKNVVIIKYGEITNGERVDCIYKIRLEENLEVKKYYLELAKRKIKHFETINKPRRHCTNMTDVFAAQIENSDTINNIPLEFKTNESMKSCDNTDSDITKHISLADNNDVINSTEANSIHSLTFMSEHEIEIICKLQNVNIKIDLQKASIFMLKKFIKYYNGDFYDILLHFASDKKLEELTVAKLVLLCIKRKENFIFYGKRLCGKRRFLEGISKSLTILRSNLKTGEDLSNNELAKIFNPKTTKAMKQYNDRAEGKAEDTVKAENELKAKNELKAEDVLKVEDELDYTIDDSNTSTPIATKQYNDQGYQETNNANMPTCYITPARISTNAYQILYTSTFDYKQYLYMRNYTITKYLLDKQNLMRKHFTNKGKEVINKYIEDTKRLKIELESKNKEIAECLDTMEEKVRNIKEERDKIEIRVNENEVIKKVMNEEVFKCNERKVIIEQEYNKIIPIIQESEEGIRMINKKSLTEIRSMIKPPEIIKMVLECVYIILEDKVKSVTWEELRVYVKKDDFISKVLNYKRFDAENESVTESCQERFGSNVSRVCEPVSTPVCEPVSIHKCEPVSTTMCDLESTPVCEPNANASPPGCTPGPDFLIADYLESNFFKCNNFTYEKANNASKACGPLFKWIEAVFIYNKIENKVNKIKNEVKSFEEKIKEKENEIKEKENEIKKLKNEIIKNEKECEKLNKNIENNKNELERIKIKCKENESINKILECEIKNRKCERDEDLCEIIEKLYCNTHGYNLECGEGSNVCVVGEGSRVCLVDEGNRVCLLGEGNNACLVGEGSGVCLVDEGSVIDMYGDISNFSCTFKLSASNFECSLKRIEYFIFLKSCLFLKNVSFNAEIFNDFLKINFNDKNLEYKIRNVMRYKNDVVIYNCNKFCIFVYDLLKFQMENKSFNVFLLNNKENEFYKNECFEVFYEEEIEKNIIKKCFENKIEIKIKEKENEFIKCINSSRFRVDGVKLSCIALELRELRNEYEMVINNEGKKNYCKSIIKKGIETFKVINEMFCKFNGYNLSKKVFEEFLYNKIVQNVICNKGAVDAVQDGALGDAVDGAVCDAVQDGEKCDSMRNRGELMRNMLAEVKDNSAAVSDNSAEVKNCSVEVKNNSAEVKNNSGRAFISHGDEQYTRIDADVASFYYWSFTRNERNSFYAKHSWCLKSAFDFERAINSNSFDYVFITDNDEKLNMIKKVFVAGSNNKEIEDELNKIVSRELQDKSKTIDSRDLILVKNIHLDKGLRKKGNQRFIFTIEKNSEYHEIMDNAVIVQCDDVDNIKQILRDVMKWKVDNLCVKVNVDKEANNDEKAIRDDNMNDVHYNLTVDEYLVVNQVRNIEMFGLSTVDNNYTDNVLDYSCVIVFFCYMKYLKNYSPFVICETYEFYMNDLLCFDKVKNIDYAVKCVFFNKFIEKDLRFVKRIYKHIKDTVKQIGKRNIEDVCNTAIDSFNGFSLYSHITMDLVYIGDYNGEISYNENGKVYEFVMCKIEKNFVVESKEYSKMKIVIDKKINTKEMELGNESNKKEYVDYVLVIENKDIYKLYTDCAQTWYRFVIILQ